MIKRNLINLLLVGFLLISNDNSLYAQSTLTLGFDGGLNHVLSTNTSVYRWPDVSSWRSVPRLSGKLSFILKRHEVVATYSRTAIVNSFNLFKHDPIFEIDEKTADFYVSIPTNMVSINYQRQMFKHNRLNLKLGGGAQIYFRHLNNDIYEDLEDTLYTSVSFINSERQATMKYLYNFNSVKDYGLNILVITSAEYNLSPNFIGNISFDFSSGLIPLMNTQINYLIKGNTANSITYIGSYQSATVNTNFSLRVGMSYSLSIKKNVD